MSTPPFKQKQLGSPNQKHISKDILTNSNLFIHTMTSTEPFKNLLAFQDFFLDFHS